MELTFTFKNQTRIQIKKVLHTYVYVHCLDSGYDLSIEYWGKDGNLTHVKYDSRDISSISTWDE